MFLLKKFLFCCDLKIGAHIIGGFTIVYGLIQLLLGFLSVAVFKAVENVQEDDKGVLRIGVTASYFLIVIGIINILAASFLISGANSDSANWVLAGFVLYVVFCVLGVTSIIFSVRSYAWIYQGIFYIFIWPYVLWVIFSLYYELKN